MSFPAFLKNEFPRFSEVRLALKQNGEVIKAYEEMLDPYLTVKEEEVNQVEELIGNAVTVDGIASTEFEALIK